jgi:hypothetical protein
MTLGAPVLIVPGLRDHLAEHWQTLLASCLFAWWTYELMPNVEPVETSKGSEADAYVGSWPLAEMLSRFCDVCCWA